MSTTITKPYQEVQPSITASRATGYVPPGQTGSHSYSAVATTRPHTPNPSTPAFINDFQWVNSYLFIHKMSTPSYRYSFMMWIFLVLVVLVVAVLHWTGSRGGPIGAAWSKWALRRRTWRKTHTLAKAKREGKPHQQPFSFPSNAQMLSLIVLFLVPLALCFVGPDYIAPATKLWDLTHNVTKRGLDHTFMHYDLASRAAVASTATTRSPEYTIPKAWWTVGGRTGIIAFALFPLVVLFALKAPPFAVFAIPFLIQVHFDKLARLHRWTGRLIWLITSIHVVTWGIQLGRDKRGTGNRTHVDSPAWLFVWQYPLFIEGVIAYIALTALVVLSLDSFRVRYYEAFYVLHIILVPITLIFAALHFPTIWWWCWSALFLWIGERLHRAIRWAYVNGLMGKGKIPAGAAPPPMKTSAHGYVSEKKPTTPSGDWEQGVRLVRSHDGEASPISQLPLQTRPRVDSRNASYDSYGAYPQDTYSDWESRGPTRNSSYGLMSKDEYDARSRVSHGFSGSQAELLQNYPPQSPVTARHETNKLNPDNGSVRYPPTINSNNNNAHTRYTRIPPPGFALCQLLPGRVVRMRLLTPRPIVWAPGQHVLLQVPSVSKYTTHPFTITGCYDDESETGEGRVVELLVRAKKGFTKDLWEEVVRLVNQVEQGENSARSPFGETDGEMENGFAVSTGPMHTREKSNLSAKKNPNEHTGVLLRAFVDGPFGSSIRAHWGSNSTVVIVVGGTGVSFGVSILEYLCLCLSGRDGQSLGGKPGGWGARGFKTSRVRFIWLVREFSHIQWCATVLRRCIEMVPSSLLQVDIFVSNNELITQPQFHGNNRNSMLSMMTPDDLAPPSAQFMRRPRASSNSSVDSLVSANSRPNSMVDLDYGQPSASSPYAEHFHSQELGHEAHVLDYTNFDGEDDTRVAGEAKISKRVQKEGKIRRAKSRRAAAATVAKTDLESKSRQGPAPVPAIELPAAMSMDRSAGSSRPARGGQTSPGPNSPPGLPQGAFSPASPHPPSSYDPKVPVSAADAYRNAAPDTFLSPATEMAAQRRWSQQSMSVFRAPSPGFHASENNNRFSVASLGDMGGAESVHRMPGERPMSMAESMLETAEIRLEIEDQELEDVHFVSEMARPGKPKLERMLADEVGRARGSVAVACCGPASLNALVRKMVATQINPQQILHGEMQGMITLITEEFQW